MPKVKTNTFDQRLRSLMQAATAWHVERAELVKKQLRSQTKTEYDAAVEAVAKHDILGETIGAKFLYLMEK